MIPKTFVTKYFVHLTRHFNACRFLTRSALRRIPHPWYSTTRYRSWDIFLMIGEVRESHRMPSIARVPIRVVNICATAAPAEPTPARLHLAHLLLPLPHFSSLHCESALAFIQELHGRRHGVGTLPCTQPSGADLRRADSQAGHLRASDLLFGCLWARWFVLRQCLPQLSANQGVPERHELTSFQTCLSEVGSRIMWLRLLVRMVLLAVLLAVLPDSTDGLARFVNLTYHLIDAAPSCIPRMTIEPSRSRSCADTMTTSSATESATNGSAIGCDWNKASW